MSLNDPISGRLFFRKWKAPAQRSHLVVINSRAENQAIGTWVTHSAYHIGLHRNPKDKKRWLSANVYQLEFWRA